MYVLVLSLYNSLLKTFKNLQFNFFVLMKWNYFIFVYLQLDC